MSEKTTEKWVCAGVRLIQCTGEKRPTLVTVWYPLDGKQLGEAMIYGGKAMRAGVGMIYTVEATRDGDRTQASRAGYVSTYEDGAKCAEWEALEQAARVSDRAAAEERKGKAADHFEKLLEPLARAYRQADPLGRQLILARAMRTIARGA